MSLPIISGKLLICPTCGKEFRNLGYHVKKHGKTAQQFRKEYGFTSYLEVVVQKVAMLFISSRTKWLLFWERKDVITNTGEPLRGYRTNDATKRSTSKVPFLDRPLSDKDIRRHLKGKCTVGVINKQTTKFICFDVDSKIEVTTEEEWESSMSLCRTVAETIIERLQKYFSPKHIHLEFSGNKGYHVWVFFDRIVRIKDVLAFAEHIAAFNNGNYLVNIEFRPESETGKGIKLPLGIHKKTGNRCVFLKNESFTPYSDQLEYLLSIEPTKPLDFSPFGEVVKQEESAIKAASKLDKILENPQKVIYAPIDYENLHRVWDEGLPSKGVRNRYTFLLAMWLKEKGYEREEVKKMLFVFTDREYKAGRTKDSAEKSVQDINATVNKVFDKGLVLKNCELSDFDLQLISFLPKRVQSTATALFQIAKWANDSCYFYLSPQYLANLVGCSERTIHYHLSILLGSLIHRTFTGIPSKKLASQQREAICKLLPADIIEELQGCNAFSKILNPKRGLNSLFFMPILQPRFFKRFTKPLVSKRDIEMVAEYSWFRYRLEFIESRELYYKEKILLNSGKELSEKSKAFHKEQAEIIIKEYFQKDIAFVKAIIYEYEDVLCNAKEITDTLLLPSIIEYPFRPSAWSLRTDS